MNSSLHSLPLAIAMTGLLACSSTDAANDAGTGGHAGTGGDAGPSVWRIFITDTENNANLGGIAGADARCVEQARLS